MTPPTAFSPLPAAAREHFKWLAAPDLQKVIKALEAAEAGSARFVGGCVRDSLLGVAPKDFDVATTLEPGAAMEALKSAGLRVAPTGMDHGTVTTIVEHRGVEVTTLRADVSTDGRRATVAFTRDWATDARRRDFTINAIYLTPDGRVFDPVGGVADVQRKQVRFIGDASARIREDSLRILRFFRFSARYCEKFDSEGLAACSALKDGVAKLSAERIGAEMSGILSLPRAGFALNVMHKSSVLAEIWDAAPDLKTANRMKELDPHAQAPIMLAALYAESGRGLGRRLRLSNAEKSMRSSALKGAGLIRAPLSDLDLRTHLYRLGKDTLGDALLLAAAGGALAAFEYQKALSFIENNDPPAFCLSGRHVVDAGVPPGPKVAEILSATEAQWIEEAFPSEARQQAILRDKISKLCN